MAGRRPLVIVIAGPNGAGKSTTAPSLLRDALQVSEFVNADTIAGGLSAFRPDSVAIAAGRAMLERIRQLAEARVRLGGHDVPEGTVRRRYQRGLRNVFGLDLPLADSWQVFDNSRAERPQLVASGRRDGAEQVANARLW